MKDWTRRFAAVGAMLLLAPVGAATAGDATARLELFAGQRMFDDGFEPVDDAAQLGATVALWRDGWPLAVTIDLMRATDDAAAPATLAGLPVTGRADVDLSEITLGVRRERGDGPWRWHYGAGVSYVDVEIESSISDASGALFAGEADDSALGLALSLGVARGFGERFSVGGALRYTDADVDIAGDEFDAGGTQLGLTLGYQW